MQGEGKYQEDRRNGQGESGPAQEIEDPSLAEGQDETEEEPAEDDDSEDELTTEAEATVTEPLQRRGCLRGCLTPVAAIIAVILVIAMIGYSKRNALRMALLKRIIVNTQNHVLGNLPQDMDEGQVEATFEEVKTALRENRVDEETLIEAIRDYQDAIRAATSPEHRRREIDRLMAGLNAAIIGIDRQK